tara:strand:- start:979 stop:1437 length:459 start_codon:yes stop_codon:yes gene_type:complete
MDTLPNIETIRDQLKGLKTSKDQYLSNDFVNKLSDLNIIKNDKFTRFCLLEIADLVRKMGESNTITLLEQNQSLPLDRIIRKSDVFLKERKRMFTNITHSLRDKKKLNASITKCPKCHSTEVESKTVQLRAGDESSTDKHRCRKCNFKFSMT